MIYTYEDIVKKTEESYIFNITISLRATPKMIINIKDEHISYTGGIITDVNSESIFYKEYVFKGDKLSGTKRIELNAKYFSDNQKMIMQLYSMRTGKLYEYKACDAITKIPSKVTFNTDILKPGSRFFMMTENNKCGIVEVTGFTLSDTNVKLIDSNSLLKDKEVIINVNDEFVKRATWKPIEEVTAFDLFRIGFNNHVMTYDYAILEHLEHIEVMPHEDKT